jgi:hypothetical protein
LHKLRRRILLDQARKRILGQWAPNDPKLTWIDLCNTVSLYNLKFFIAESRVFKKPILDAAITMIYDSRSAVRQEGNEVAHEAPIELVRDAIRHADQQDYGALANIFQCVFDEDLDELRS